MLPPRCESIDEEQYSSLFLCLSQIQGMLGILNSHSRSALAIHFSLLTNGCDRESSCCRRRRRLSARVARR